MTSLASVTGDQCGVGLHCAAAASGMKCQARVGEGAACTGAAECLEGLYCVTTGATGTCSAGPAGQPCSSEAPCPDGFFCGDHDEVCLPQHGLGEDCWPDEPCTAELYCDMSDGCQPRKVLGEACDTYALCAPGLYCDSARTCQPRAGLGEACDPYSNGIQCTEDLRCDSSTSPAACAAKSGVGEHCSGNADCQSAVCDYSYGCLVSAACVMP